MNPCHRVTICTCHLLRRPESWSLLYLVCERTVVVVWCANREHKKSSGCNIPIRPGREEQSHGCRPISLVSCLGKAFNTLISSKGSMARPRTRKERTYKHHHEPVHDKSPEKPTCITANAIPTCTCMEEIESWAQDTDSK